jgi:hypothetical protein
VVQKNNRRKKYLKGPINCYHSYPSSFANFKVPVKRCYDQVQKFIPNPDPAKNSVGEPNADSWKAYFTHPGCEVSSNFTILCLPEIEDSANGERTGFSSFGNRLASCLRKKKQFPLKKKTVFLAEKNVKRRKWLCER